MAAALDNSGRPTHRRLNPPTASRPESERKCWADQRISATQQPPQDQDRPARSTTDPVHGSRFRAGVRRRAGSGSSSRQSWVKETRPL
jgi:hypothetical protein